MTAQAVWALRTRASRGAVRWAGAAVIALLVALAVLIHHETAVAGSSTPSAATHVMTPGMVMTDSRSGPEPIPGHGHGSGPEQTAEPIVTAPPMGSAHGQACSGMAMQHCATASFEVVKLVPPTQSRESSGLASYGAVTAAPKVAGAADRAPPDLSVLSQLRI
ncbi:hypothetical protein GCM10010236_70800 [Streptomyces eurythermus]|nr:hypothetical protein GCM10010236_70800 [Streptomyces eurythermus]